MMSKGDKTNRRKEQASIRTVCLESIVRKIGNENIVFFRLKNAPRAGELALGRTGCRCGVFEEE